MKQQKQFKKEIRHWAGKSYERLLNKALRELDDAFGQWRSDHLSPFVLSDKIHEFHDGRSRYLYSLDQPSSWEHMIAVAVYEKVLDPEELPGGVWEHIHPRVELLKNTEIEAAAEQ